jgi:hypothetical protein
MLVYGEAAIHYMNGFHLQNVVLILGLFALKLAFR